MGIALVKTNLFFHTFIFRHTPWEPRWPFSRGMSNLWFTSVEYWRHLTTDVSYFGPYAETKNNGDEQKVCMKWIQFRSWFRPSGIKVSSFIIQKFSRCFSLSFNVSVDIVQMFLSCSMIMIFPWLLKSWSWLLKCLQAGVVLGFLTPFCGYWA